MAAERCVEPINPYIELPEDVVLLVKDLANLIAGLPANTTGLRDRARVIHDKYELGTYVDRRPMEVAPDLSQTEKMDRTLDHLKPKPRVPHIGMPLAYKAESGGVYPGTICKVRAEMYVDVIFMMGGPDVRFSRVLNVPYDKGLSRGWTWCFPEDQEYVE